MFNLGEFENLHQNIINISRAIIPLLSNTIVIGGTLGLTTTVNAQESLSVVYPPEEHQTTAEQIFIIGTSSPKTEVLINGQTIRRSPQGHFAPSFPLKLGENIFTLRGGNQEQTVTVTRISEQPTIPTGASFAENSLTPAEDIARLPGELICFGAVAPPNAQVSVRLRNRLVTLVSPPELVQLPANSAVLIDNNQPRTADISNYQGCTSFSRIGNLGVPKFKVSLNGKQVTQKGTGAIEIISPDTPEVIEVIADTGTARTGPSTDYSRLTPLPQGTRASVTGKEGAWLRLDYGAWIKAEETQTLSTNVPPRSLIRSITSRKLPTATEIILPLQVPVPVKIQQEDQKITLTLYNTTAQTDTIRLDDDSFIKRMDWQQVTPTEIAYTFHLKTAQQSGYDLRYEGTNLVLSLRHPPKLSSNSSLPLQGIRILLDPGHGGSESGTKGPTGYPEKEMNLVISKLLEKDLQQLGATVYLTRESDRDLSLKDRMTLIDNIKPDLAISIHYNALPDGGDAENTQGISTFWYHPQAHNFAVSLHNYLVTKLNRPDYGVFWNNLALTRPHTAPSILLELGFAINPWEYEWISDPQEQKRLSKVIAEGIVNYFD
ncbi:MAG: N-acetylmuramoyl-L-alanine amidase [Xenococcus sp. MO_188.B8]|nr:N-acetylmuramoyl-L-alanine amidase [Xenococcus sp. MO_188.B8]